MFGLENVKSIPNDFPESSFIIEHFANFEVLRYTNDEDLAVQLITKLKCDQVQQIPPHLHNSRAVWITLIPILEVSELIASLPKLLRLGFLNEGQPFLTMITDIFTNENIIKDSNIHPVEIFIGLMDYLHYGRPLNSFTICTLRNLNLVYKLKEQHLLSIISTDLSKALGKAIQVAINQIEPMNRKFLIGIDLVPEMLQPCFMNRNTSCLEIACFYLFLLLKTEPYITVITFSGQIVKPLTIDKESKYYDILTLMKSMINIRNKFIQTKTFKWATVNNQKFDVFMHFTLQGVKNKEPFADCVTKYRMKISPNAKLITFLLKKGFPTVAEAVSNAIDICGFSNNVPKILHAFIFDYFQ